MKMFNLVDEPWIPVRDGPSMREVGLREALVNAHAFERIEAASPLVEVALTRVLLAVLHRAYMGPTSSEEQSRIFLQGSFDPEIVNNYLDRWYERFWLFHPSEPFWQIPDLPDDDPLPWTKLRAEYAVGNNPTLFDHTFDDNPPAATYAEAARSLIAHQTFTTGGLIRRFGVQSGVGAPLAVSAAFLPLGDSLFQTLAQAFVVYEPEGDLPIWESEPVRVDEVRGDEKKQPRKKQPLFGVTRVYSWLSRGVRLLPENGSVRYIAYGPGVHPVTAHFFRDPLVAYSKNSKSGELAPVRLRADKAFWRDFEALFPEADAGLSPQVLESARYLRLQASIERLLPVEVAGQVTDQAKVLEIRRERYPLPGRFDHAFLRLYMHRALEHANKTSDCLRSGGWLLAMLLLSTTRSPDKQEVRALLDSFPLLSTYWNQLGNAFTAFLEKLNGDPRTALADWESQLRVAADSSWSLTTKAVGTEARQLKAIQEAERKWRSCVVKEVASEKKG